MEQAPSNTAKAIRGVSTQSLVTLALGVVEIVVFSFMSHLLSKEDFGYFSAITAITTIFASFSETGIGSSIIQRKEVNQRYVNNAFTMGSLMGTSLMLLLFFLSGPLSRAVGDVSLKKPLMIMSVTLLCNCLTSINNSLMYKKLQFLKVGVIQLTSITVSGIVSIVLAARGFGFYAILCQAVMISVLSFLISFFASGAKYHFSLEKGTVKEIWSFSSWLMASVVFRNLAQQIDNLMMPRLLSMEALGAYNRPRTFIEKISSKLNSIFDIALFPILSGIQDDQAAMKRAFEKVLFSMSLVGTGLFVLFFFNAELIIKIFLGAKWLDLMPLFQIFAFLVIFKIYGRLADCMLRSLAMTKQQFFFRIAEFAAKFPAIILGAKWGMYGIAIAVVLTDTVMRAIKICFIAMKIKYPVGGVFCKIAVSNKAFLLILPAMVALYVFLPHTLFGNIALAAGSLLTFAIVFCCLPSFVGTTYQEDIWPPFKRRIFSILKKCI